MARGSLDSGRPARLDTQVVVQEQPNARHIQERRERRVRCERGRRKRPDGVVQRSVLGRQVHREAGQLLARALGG